MGLKPVDDKTIYLKTPREIEIMREAGRVVARTARYIRERARPGMTTLDLDRMAAEQFALNNAVSTSKGYCGFPGYICVSVNEQIVHGIPGELKLHDGDLVKVDVAAKRRGYVGDTACSFVVGDSNDELDRLMRVTREALMKGIEAAQPGRKLGDVGYAIQKHAEAHGMSVVRVFVGHGVGRSMHEAPQVPHYGTPGKGITLRPGMCIAIEPQLNLGTPDVEVLQDTWTAVTKDGLLSAHFEHTVAIRETGPDILTLED